MSPCALFHLRLPRIACKVSLSFGHSCLPQLLLCAFLLQEGIEGQLQAPWSVALWPHIPRVAIHYLSRRHPAAALPVITLTNGISLCCCLVCWSNHCIIKPTDGLRLLKAVGLFWGSTVHLSSSFYFGSNSTPPAKYLVAVVVFSFCFCVVHHFLLFPSIFFTFFVDFWNYSFIYLF